MDNPVDNRGFAVEEVCTMVVKNENQALCIAQEMERRAIRVYERALMLAEDPAVKAGILEILQDEQRHLARFTEMREGYPVDAEEERMLIAGMAADVLFSGGVVEMKRSDALTTLPGLYCYAADSEAGAVRTYASFAQACGDSAVRSAFMDIVHEESSHLADLRARIAGLEQK